jgi:hypothetical protein
MGSFQVQETDSLVQVIGQRTSRQVSAAGIAGETVQQTDIG